MQLKDLLKNEGYLTIALPSADVSPLQILVEDPAGGLKRLPDKVYQLFKPGQEAALPPVNKDATVANLSGTVVTNSAATASLGLMKSLFQKIGASLDFAANATVNDQLVCMFESPLKDEISSFIELDSFLNDATLNEGTYVDMLKHNNIYIITAVLKSSHFAVGLVDTSAMNAALTLPSIKDFVEGSLTASKTNDARRVVEYKGDQALVFGVRAVRVIFDRTAWQALTGQKGRFSVEDTSGVLVRDVDEVKVTYLQGENLTFS